MWYFPLVQLHDKKTHEATCLIFHTFHSYSSPRTEECRSTRLYSRFSLIENAQMFYRVRVCKKSSNSWSNCYPNLDLCPIIGPIMLYDIISYYSIVCSVVFLHVLPALPDSSRPAPKEKTRKTIRDSIVFMWKDLTPEKPRWSFQLKVTSGDLSIIGLV